MQLVVPQVQAAQWRKNAARHRPAELLLELCDQQTQRRLSHEPDSLKLNLAKYTAMLFGPAPH